MEPGKLLHNVKTQEITREGGIYINFLNNGIKHVSPSGLHTTLPTVFRVVKVLVLINSDYLFPHNYFSTKITKT